MTSSAMAQQIEMWDIQRLVPSGRNARTHSDAQIAELAGSMKAYGVMVPVLVDPDGVIIAGHARVLAAHKLSLERVPVVVIQHLKASVDLPLFLTQPVKTQNPFKGELSHGVVEKDVHQGVQAGRSAAAGTRSFHRRSRTSVGSERERAAPLAA
jgi:hypothetical protein